MPATDDAAARFGVLRTPRVTLAAGVACVALGAALTLWPFSSLEALVLFVAVSVAVSGIGELLSARRRSSPWLARCIGGLWIAAAVAAVAWTSVTVRALAVLVGAALLAGGAARLVDVFRGRGDRFLEASRALASVVFGVLAAAWPDITVLVVALLVGPRTVLYGLGLVAETRRGRRAGASAPARRRWIDVAWGVVSLVAALGLLAASAFVHHESSGPGAFYTPPRAVPAFPGALLRSEPFARGVPNGARAWRILYTTTNADGGPAVASAVVLASKRLPPGPRPVVAWAHGTTGIVPKCAPSLLSVGFTANVPAIPQLLARGWIFVATDYVGLGTRGPSPYLIGGGEARSVLDSVRAARRLQQLRLAQQIVVWGHSQGGHAALWTGILAPRYAPDLHVEGVAAIAPASDLRPLVREVKDTVAGRIIAAYLLGAYSAAYRDVSFDAALRPAARPFVRATAGRCLAGPEAFVSLLATLPLRQSLFARDPTGGALGRRLRENTPTKMIRAPLLIAQGLSDSLVLPGMQAAYVRKRCAAGQSLVYRTYAGEGHLAIVGPSSPLVADLVSWTAARFAGKAPQTGCRTIAR